LKSVSDCDVVVIGSGAAGLAAFEMLDKAGLRVIVLEARDRVGGRICTVHDPLSPLPLELGAEFVHGRPAEIWDVIRDAGLAVYDGADESRYMNDGKVERNANAWELVASVIHDMRRAAQGPDQSFEQFLASTSYGEDAKRVARGYIEGFNAAESKLISIQALAEEIGAADEIDGGCSFRFSRGYDAIALQLLRAVPDYQSKLRLNMAAESVSWRRDAVSVFAGRCVWQAHKTVITVPLGVLQAGSIAFSPEPSDIVRAAKALQFGHVYRVVLRFRSAFWESRDELKDVGFILSRETFFPTWWTTLAMHSTILTGWSAGAHANGLVDMSREEILDQALHSLARITGVAFESIREQLETMYFHDWQRDVFARGAYSYVPAGALWARKQLSIPVEDTLYFAGEATDQTGHSATVHGAIASGRRAARQILGIAPAPADG
jgi:monoamine oxidase